MTTMQVVDDRRPLEQFGLSDSALTRELEYLDIDQSMAGARGVVIPYSIVLVALFCLMVPFSPLSASILWAASFALYIFLRRQMNQLYASWSVDERKARMRRWHITMIVTSVGFGSVWGSGMMIAFPGSPPELRMLWTLAVTMVVAGAPRLLTIPQFVGLVAALLVFACGSWLIWGDWLGLPMAFALGLLAGLFVVMARHFHKGMREKFELQLRNEHLARMLAQRNTTLEEMSQARTMLLAAASHDLRQPVHALGLLMDTLQRATVPGGARRQLNMADQCVESLSEMLSNLLDFTRMDSGSFPVRHRFVPLQEILDECVRTFEPMAQHKNLELRIVRTPLAVRTDPHLTRRMLFNLISNAIKYTASGSVEVSATELDGQVTLHVEDTGVGIAPERLEDIFRDYVTSDMKTIRFDMGIGLGLGIVRRCANLLDQQVSVQSEPGKGSRFSIHLGAAVALSHASPRASVDTVALWGVVAIIENDPVILEGLSEMLREWGCQPVAGATPEQVQSLLDQAQLTPRLILSDLHLGTSGTGFDAIESLRRHTGVQDAPAVLLTGDISPVHLQRATAENVRLEHKPLRPTRLREVLGAMLAPA